MFSQRNIAAVMWQRGGLHIGFVHVTSHSCILVVNVTGVTYKQLTAKARARLQACLRCSAKQGRQFQGPPFFKQRYLLIYFLPREISTQDTKMCSASVASLPGPQPRAVPLDFTASFRASAFTDTGLLNGFVFSFSINPLVWFVQQTKLTSSWFLITR